MLEEQLDPLFKVELGEYQRAAIYLFTLTCGIGAFSKLTLLKLNCGDQHGACDALRRWVYGGGNKWRGLINRRDMERSLCLAESADDLGD